MINLRIRTISLVIDGTRYDVDFKPKMFGRVGDIKVYSNKFSPMILGRDTSVKIAPQLSVRQALKYICGAVKEELTSCLRR